MTDRVGQVVGDDLGDPVAVCKRGRLAGYLDRDLFLCSQWREALGDVRRDLAQIDSLAGKRQLFGLGAPELGQVVHEHGQAPRFR